MDRRLVDCRGLSCPLPVMRVMAELAQGGAFTVVVNESIAVENISRLLGSRGVSFTVAEGENESRIEINA